MAMVTVTFDDREFALVPRQLSGAALQAARGAMPAEFDYWQESGRIHARLRPLTDCVDPNSVWGAAIKKLDEQRRQTSREHVDVEAAEASRDV